MLVPVLADAPPGMRHEQRFRRPVGNDLGAEIFRRGRAWLHLPGGPFVDRRERAGARHHRAQPDRQQLRQRMPHSAAGSRIGTPFNNVSSAVGSVGRVVSTSGTRQRWHERVWSSGSMVDMRTTIKTSRTTPVTHATRCAPPQTRRSQSYPTTLPEPCRRDPLKSGDSAKDPR